MTVRFENLAVAAGLAGLRAIDRGNGHWQLVGGPHLVNFYPSGAKGPTLYVAGSGSGKRLDGTEREIIDAAIAATERPPRRERAAKRRGSYRAAKRRMFRRDRRCHWCRLPLVLDRGAAHDGFRFATLDHKIPLDAGGLDQPNNWVLACDECNAARGNSTGPPPSVDARREP